MVRVTFLPRPAIILSHVELRPAATILASLTNLNIDTNYAISAGFVIVASLFFTNYPTV